MAWLALVVAGSAAVAWAVGLKDTAGFARPSRACSPSAAGC